jgi:FdhE protein
VSTALDGLIRQHPEMGPAAATVRALASALPDTSLPDRVPHLGAAEARLAAGIAALDGELLLSGSTLLANLRTLALALGSTVAAHTAEALPDALEQGLRGSAPDELAAAAQAGVWDAVAELAARLGLDPDLVITLADHASRPALRSGARAVHELVMRSHWNRGTCPSCGAAPLLAELRAGGAPGSAERQRVLRCGRCLTGWPFPRLRCVACGESNHHRLAYLHGSGEGTFRRADVCSTCHTYLKSIAVLAPLTLCELLEMDLATAALDLAAVQRGLHR